MSPTLLLEALASYTHHDCNLYGLINNQPISLKQAILKQEVELLRDHFVDSTKLANMTKVVNS